MERLPEKEVPGESPPLPLPLRALGWLAFAGAFALALRLAYEQTVMTWLHGLQMVGFTLVHIYGGLFVLGLLAALGVHVWLFGFLALVIRRRLTRKNGPPVGAWAEFAVLAVAAALFYVPYGMWQLTSLELAGPGREAADQLTVAALQDQKYLVRAFLSEGVPIDAPGNYGKTPLNQACRAEKLAMARYLVSKGAKLDRAPDCRRITEFAVFMKPVEPSPQQLSRLPQVPGTTVEVTAPEPDGYRLPSAKP
jgi:hypothetical protein